MTTNQQPFPMANEPQEKPEEPKSQAQLDYESGVEALKNQDFGQAANAFHNAIIEYEQSDDKTGVANANDKLGDVCRESQELENALAYYEKAFSICEEFDDIYSLISLKDKKAQCHQGLKQYDAAIDLYMELLDQFERMRSPGSSVAILVKLADVFVESGNLQGAIDANKTAASIHSNFSHKRKAQDFLDRVTELEKQMDR